MHKDRYFFNLLFIAFGHMIYCQTA